MGILDFVERGLLGESEHRLTPVQRFVLKMVYGEPLDANDKTIWANQTLMTETEYVAFLHDEGRCNVNEGEHHFGLAAIAKGRRSGGTFLTAAMMAFEVYDLLQYECPQKQFGMHSKSIIGIMGVGHSGDAATGLGEQVAKNIRRVRWFDKHTARSARGDMTFQTQHDIDTTGSWAGVSDATASVSLLLRNATVRAMKGHSCKTVFLDEMAFYRSEVYAAMVPTVMAFGAMGRLLMLSSTNGKRDEFYKTFKGAAEGRAGVLTLQIPTWEFNPMVDRAFMDQYRQRHGEDQFQAEFGAQFIDLPREG